MRCDACLAEQSLLGTKVRLQIRDFQGRQRYFTVSMHFSHSYDTNGQCRSYSSPHVGQHGWAFRPVGVFLDNHCFNMCNTEIQIDWSSMPTGKAKGGEWKPLT